LWKEGGTRTKTTNKRSRRRRRRDRSRRTICKGIKLFSKKSRKKKGLCACDIREKSETPDDDTSETPRGMIDNRLRF
jgi:hypothetical protein